MKVRFVTNASFPDGQAATSRIRCYSRAIAEAGHDVEVVAPNNFGNYFAGRQFFHRNSFFNIRILLLTNTKAVRKNVARYLWEYTAPFFLLAHTVLTCRRSDVFIVYFNTALTRFIMLLCLRLMGRKVIIELNEYPYVTEGSRITHLPFIKQFLSAFTLWLIFPLAHGFLVISKRLEVVASRYSTQAKILRVPILVEVKANESHAIAVNSNDLYLFHAGSLSEQKDGILAFFEAFALAHLRIFQKHQVTLKLYLTNLTAFQSILDRIHSLMEKYDLREHVVVTGFCDENRLANYLADSLALVINKPVNIQNLHNFPTKLGTYLDSGRPVIVACENMEMNEYLHHEENALVVKPNNALEIADAIVWCFENPSIARIIGQNGATTARERFYFAKHSQRISDFINEL